MSSKTTSPKGYRPSAKGERALNVVKQADALVRRLENEPEAAARRITMREAANLRKLLDQYYTLAGLQAVMKLSGDVKFQRATGKALTDLGMPPHEITATA